MALDMMTEVQHPLFQNDCLHTPSFESKASVRNQVAVCS